MKFNSDTLDKLRLDLNKVLEAYGIDNGISFQLGRISYADDYANIAIKAYRKDETVNGVASEFAVSANKLGVPADWYKKAVVLSGEDYIITGINLRARKYPLICQGVTNGKSIKTTVYSVRASL